MTFPRKRVALAIALTLAASAVATAATEAFVFDKSHSQVGFRIRHWLTKVEGRFKEYDGKIWVDRANPSESKVEIAIQAASIDTGSERRDNHLKSADFFEVEKYPTITFKSTKVEPKGKDVYAVTGDLSMHGVTKTITIPVRHTGFLNLGKQEKAGFELTIPIQRKDFGIAWNRASDQGGAMLGDEVEVTVLVEANKEMPEAASPPPPAPTKAPATSR
ncbi:MAG TPA: YceI family protein [Thermoanaerobaculia bacterium]|nr:YceI family protein [Thermoanaerobaculia bacterium]